MKYLQFEYIIKLSLENDEIIRAKLSDGKVYTASIINHRNSQFMALIDNKISTVEYFFNNNILTLWADNIGRYDFDFENHDICKIKSNQSEGSANGRIFSAMPCKINQMLVHVGDFVEIDSQLCITEAMKMEVNLIISLNCLFVIYFR